MQPLLANVHTTQAMLDDKDSRISALEKDIQILEDKLLTLLEKNFNWREINEP